MRTFKSYLNEVRTGTSTSDLVFRSIRASVGAINLNIPISPSMFKRIWPDTLRATVFHTTDGDGIESIARLEGQKKSISAFFDMGARYMLQGIATPGGEHVVLEMDADVLLSAAGDVMTNIDKAGRRWTTISDLQEAARLTNFSAVERDLRMMIRELVLKYLTPIMGLDDTRKADEWEMWSNMKRKVDRKTLSVIIKDYMDGMEKVIKKHSDTFSEAMMSYAKKRTTDYTWDEQVVNNIKVKTMHLFELPDENGWMTDLGAEQQQLLDFAKSKKWSTKTWKDASELEIYTGEIAKKELGK